MLNFCMLLVMHISTHAQQTTSTKFFADQSQPLLASTQPVVLLQYNSHSGNEISPFKNKISHWEDNNVVTAFTITTSVIEPSCGYNNGAIIVTPSGGVAPYSYTLYPLLHTRDNGFIGGYSASTYTVMVHDATGAEVTSGPITLTNTLPAPMITIGTVIRPSSCTSFDGSVEVLVSGGKPPYRYTLDNINYQTSNVFTGLSGGNYTFIVQDANGCFAKINTLAISSFDPPGCLSPLGYGYSGGTCGAPVTLDISSGNPLNPYSVSTDGVNYPPPASIFYFNNLTPGVYNFWIKNQAGDVRVFSYSIAFLCLPELKGTATVETCGQNNASLTLTASGGSAPYTYSIDGINFQSSNVFSGLHSGTYSATARDADGKLSFTQISITDNCPVITGIPTGETCAGNDGTITAVGSDGTPPYQYSIDGINFQTSNIFNGLAAGSYSLTIRDGNGSKKTTTVVVPYSCIMVTATGVNTTCGNNNGSITGNATGGTSPYTYSIDAVNFQTSNIFQNLAAGNYTLTAKDANNKLSSTTVVIAASPKLTILPSTTVAGCSNDNGTITLSGAGGTAPYQYSLNGSIYQAGNFFTGLPSGVYPTFIKDAAGCIVTGSMNVYLSCPSISAAATGESCQQRNGTISVSIIHSNGLDPYTYSLDGTTFQNSPVFTGLAANNYTVIIKDRLGNVHMVNSVVASSCPVVTAVASPANCGLQNGKITATGSAGKAPYQYSIDGVNYQSSPVFLGLAANTYLVRLKDADNVIVTTSVVVALVVAPSVSVSTTQPTCVNNDGSISVSVTNGSAPFQYSINGQASQTSANFNSLPAGNYSLLIKDANGCEVTKAITLAFVSNIATQTGGPATICEGQNILLNTVSNGTSFSWTPSTGLDNAQLKEPTASPTVTTKYYLTTRLGACTKLDSFLVNVRPAPLANAGVDISICFGQSTQLHGSGGLNYTWTPSVYLSNSTVKDPDVLNPQVSTTYKLSIKDGNGCSSVRSDEVIVNVTPPPVLFAGNDTSVAMGQPFQLHARDVNNAGLINYSWSPSTGLSNVHAKDPVARLDADITYVVKASTPQGCESSARITVKVYRGPQMYVPSAFTPNNDGKNDVLYVRPIGFRQFKSFVIYDRYGNMIFSTNDALKGWDGKYKQTPQSAGAYVWMANGVDNEGKEVVKKGTVLLVR